jgi:Domain of unknown function (DUF4145)
MTCSYWPEISIFDFIGQQMTVLWKAWSCSMDVKPLARNNEFSMSGVCPHCDHSSAFLMVTNAHAVQENNVQNQSIGSELWAVMQCQGCLRYILGGAYRAFTFPGQPQTVGGYQYRCHYPIGKPNDNVAEEVPEHIAADFGEALRCQFIDAHNATVEMCRRAVQARCIDLGAPTDKKLVHQIDWLAAQGKITAPLKEMTHRVRMGGELGRSSTG